MTFFPFGCRCLYLLLLSCVCLAPSLYLHVIDRTWMFVDLDISQSTQLSILPILYLVVLVCTYLITQLTPLSVLGCTCRCLITQLAPLFLLGFTWLNWLYWLYVLGWTCCYLMAQPPTWSKLSSLPIFLSNLPGPADWLRFLTLVCTMCNVHCTCLSSASQSNVVKSFYLIEAGFEPWTHLKISWVTTNIKRKVWQICTAMYWSSLIHHHH